jgi:hypothetical protein
MNHNEKWIDEEVKEELLLTMQENLFQARTVNLWSAFRFARKKLLAKGVPTRQIKAAGAQIFSLNGESDGVRILTVTQRYNALRRALESLKGLNVMESFESFFAAFTAAYRERLGTYFSKELFDPGGPFERELADFKPKIADLWQKSLERMRLTPDKSQLTQAVSEELQYRRLERTERHRLRRQAEEEALHKARAEEETKRRSEEARRERDRRKAEARQKAEEARARAQARAEAKRAEWLAAHPRKQVNRP